MIPEDIEGNVYTEDKAWMLERTNRATKKVVGMDALPEKFEWQHWLPVIRKILVLVVTALGAYGAEAVSDAAKGSLDTTASQANQVVKVEEILAGEYENFYEYIRWHDAHEAKCDAALEMFARHRAEDLDWQTVVEECHSEGVLPAPDAGRGGTEEQPDP